MLTQSEKNRYIVLSGNQKSHDALEALILGLEMEYETSSSPSQRAKYGFLLQYYMTERRIHDQSIQKA